jgi:hypothetical protein
MWTQSSSRKRRPHIFRRLLFNLLLGALGVHSINLWAEDFKNLKGARDFIQLKSECEYLSPDYALGMIRQGKLLNDYLYGEDEHPATKLIQMVFNIPPTSENPAFFQVSPLSKNVARFLAPSTAGKLISFLSQKEPGHWDEGIQGVKTVLATSVSSRGARG